MSRASRARPRKRPAGHARRPRGPIRHRLRGRLPSAARILAGLCLALLVGGAVALVNGPWLRVARVASAGAHFTTTAELNGLLAPYEGSPLLTIDSQALVDRLEALPAVARATVSPRLPDRLEVTITEKQPAFSWLTRSARLVVAGDGAVVAVLAHDAELPEELASLPSVDDQRSASRGLSPGHELAATELDTVRRLLAIDPALVGSATSRFDVRIDDEYGFLLVAHAPDWTAALGFYRLDPGESRAAANSRLDAQLAAIRTLFSTRAEAGVSWVDARNPGKVYWAP